MAKLSFENFKRHIKDIQLMSELQDRIDDAKYNFNKSETKEEFHFLFPTGIDNIIELLAMLTNDRDEWISYWIYELDFGKRADALECTDGEGNIIPLHTIEDLWTVLNQSEE